MRTRFSSDRKTTSWFLGLASAMVVNRLSIVEYLGLRLEGFRVLDRRAPALSDCEEPFGAVVTDADPDTFAAVSCPALQELPLLAPYTERCSTELIVAPDVALTKLPATNGAVATTTDPAPVLSPSQVRCFFDCQARWWFKYGLQLPERKNSSLALGLAVHQALEVNFREKIETQEDLETTGVVIVFREAWMEQAPQTEFMPGESHGDLRRLGERLVAKYMDEVAPKVEPAAVELDVHGEIAGVAVRGKGGRAGCGRPVDRFQDSIPPAFVCLARPRVPTRHLPADHSRREW